MGSDCFSVAAVGAFLAVFGIATLHRYMLIRANRKNNPLGWIRSKDRLPQIDSTNLVFTGDTGFYFIGEYLGPDDQDGIEWCDEYDGQPLGEITHWMPLPTPPKGMKYNGN